MEKEMRVVKLMLESRNGFVEDKKKQLASHLEEVTRYTKSGHYNSVAQYAEKVVQLGFEIDAAERELDAMKQMLEYLEGEDEE